MNSNVATGTVLNTGHAPYKDDPKNQPSFFVELENQHGTKSKFWGLGLEDALNKNNINKGETVALLDKGIVEGTRRREWEIEKYEPLIEHKNSIENGAEKITDKGKSVDFNEPQLSEIKRENLKDEIDLPDSIKNNYIAMVRNRLFQDQRINFYDKEDNTSIAFEDRNTTLNTSRQDEKTVKAMLDIAQAKSWTSISLKGTEEFKKQAWLEANLRGIEAKGYTPTEKDIAELKMKQEERTNNTIQHEKSSEKEISSLPLNNTLKDEEKTVEPVADPASKDAALTNDVYKQVDDITKEFSRTKDIKAYLDANIIQGIEKKEIKSRDDVTNFLRSQGLNIVRDDKKTITIENPMGNRNIILKGELYEKDLKENIENEKLVSLINTYRDELPQQEQGVTKHTGLDKLRVTLDSYKDKIAEKDLVNIEAYKLVIQERFKNNPEKANEKLEALSNKIPDIVSGKVKLPEPPTIKQHTDISINVSKQGDQDRSR